MCEFWNRSDLNKPPINSAKVYNINKNEITKLQNILQDSLDSLQKQKLLHHEAALLSRFIYRMKHKFRSDKCLKIIEQINKCLRHYLNTDIIHDISTFSNSVYIDNEDDNERYLPSRQMLEYVLVRLQAFLKLLCKIISLSELCAFYLNARLKTGQFWHVAIIVYGIVSRIWVLLKHLTIKICYSYYELLKYHKILQLSGLSWLPENYQFPQDLNVWLNVDWITKENSNLNLVKNEKIFSLIESSEEENIEIVTDELEKNCNIKTVLNLKNTIDDIGEVYVEDKKEKKIKNKHKLSDLKQIDSLLGLKKFVKKEEKLRKENKALSLSKNMDSMQWRFFKSIFETSVEKIKKAEMNQKTDLVIKRLTKCKKSLRICILSSRN